MGMARKFRDELRKLEKSVHAMGTKAACMLHDSVAALKEKDSGLARDVIKRDEGIDELDDDIEDNALKLIALYQPMAGDMRTVAVSLKMITYITRVGKYAKDISNHVLDLNGSARPRNAGTLLRMEAKVSAMIADALDAYKTRDISKLSSFGARDDEVDALFDGLFKECDAATARGEITPSCHLDYVMIARYLERCGDHACKMAEKVHYMVTGERISIQ